jgi:hypothetical protein
VEADAVDGTTTTARDVITNGAASNAIVAESVIGFIRDNGDTDAFDAILKKDAGTATNPLTDVTNATSIPSASRTGVLTDDEFVKLGLKFDGRDKLAFYANGFKVYELTVDSTVDQSHDLCVVCGIKTGTAAAEQVAWRRIRFAFQDRDND